MKKHAASTLATLALSAVVFAAGGVASAGEAKVRPDHPRLFITKDDPYVNFEMIKKRVASGMQIPPGVAGDALKYLVFGDEAAGKKALTELKTLSSKDDVDLAMAFDWLFHHPQFSDADKRSVAEKLSERALKDVWVPSYICNNRQFWRQATWLPVAYALYGHDPKGTAKKVVDMYEKDLVQKIFTGYDEFFAGGDWFEGGDYYRMSLHGLIDHFEARRTATGDDLFMKSIFFQGAADMFLYRLTPNFTFSLMSDNDHPHPYHADIANMHFTAYALRNPYVKWVEEQFTKGPAVGWGRLYNTLYLDPELKPAQPTVETVPTGHLFPGTGLAEFRSDWTRGATWVEFVCGDYFGSHSHRQQNHFAVYRKGWLAIDSGAYPGSGGGDHYLNYLRRTLAHNSMLIYMPDENFRGYTDRARAANDGGQRMGSTEFGDDDYHNYGLWSTSYDWDMYRKRKDMVECGDVTGFYDDAQMGYVRGDATAAYNPKKCSHFVRQLLFLKDDGCVLVFDRVGSKRGKDGTHYKKYWLMHFMGEPEVIGAVQLLDAGPGHKTTTGKRFRVTSSPGAGEKGPEFEGGELLGVTILPEESTLVVRGGPGHECDIPGMLDFNQMTNEPGGEDDGYTVGKYRIEVSDTVDRGDSVFFHLLVVGDKGQVKEPNWRAIRTDELSGIILGSRAIVFARDSQPVRQAAFTVLKEGVTTCLVSDVVPGKAYEVKINGKRLAGPIFSPGEGGPLIIPCEKDSRESKIEITLADGDGKLVSPQEKWDSKAQPIDRWTKVHFWELSGGARAARVISPALKDPHPSVRRKAVAALGKLKEPEAVPALSAALSDDDVQVAAQAARALAAFSDPRTIPALVQALGNAPDVEVRLAAAQALQAQEGPAVSDALEKALKKETDTNLKTTLIVALAAQGRLDEAKNALKSPDAAMRLAGTLALAKAAGVPKRDSSRLGSPDEARKLAMEVIKGGDKALWRPAVEALEGESPMLLEAVAVLQKRLPDEGANAAIQAALPLAARDDRAEVNQGLVELLHSSDAGVRAAARAALERRNRPGDLQRLGRIPVWLVTEAYPRGDKPPLDPTQKTLDLSTCKPYQPTDGKGFVDLEMTSRIKQNASAFAVAVLESPADREIALRLGADDLASIWLNGELILDGRGTGESMRPETFSARGFLSKGRNVVVARVDQTTGFWLLSLRLADAAGKPLSDLTYPQPDELGKSVAQTPAKPVPAPSAFLGNEIVISAGKDGYAGWEDTELDGLAKDRPQYTESVSELYGDATGNIGLVRANGIDLLIPHGRDVAKATLRFRLGDRVSGKTGALRVFRLTRFVDFTQATWDYRNVLRKEKWGKDAPEPGPPNATNRVWGPPQAGIDYAPEPVVTKDIAGLVPKIQSDDWIELDVTPCVRHWVEKPAENFGLLLWMEKDKGLGEWVTSKSEASKPTIVIQLK